ncbi:hypothetical protein FPQ18DRAFT_307214 [Pyronema domesticum]|uniref:Aminoglycoside phosphotransferase domain-containing protein n=1 Tax=Pyronema omphalodes (strain CBS 100304) TaxID=1076935 RepID=U4LGI3_PYROM|nr:hypothetical protein FPQ18DRAFT_307214 [Pyronema domesticum]CCX30642.1 Similar to conserved hypothetical protein [Ajellomyces capsulatus H88]; acc. no. EGC45715 [Pyronema omphalodes CBS 100304]
MPRSFPPDLYHLSNEEEVKFMGLVKQVTNVECCCICQLPKSAERKQDLIYELDLDDGSRCYAYVSPHSDNLVLASEIQTMKYCRNKLGIPQVPAVIYFGRPKRLPLNIPYFITGPIRGRPLAELWKEGSDQPSKKAQALHAIVSAVFELATVADESLRGIGSLRRSSQDENDTVLWPVIHCEDLSTGLSKSVQLDSTVTKVLPAVNQFMSLVIENVSKSITDDARQKKLCNYRFNIPTEIH